MNGYNILVIILACVVLGVSIWAFVTRCNTDKFGDDDDDMTYDKFIENCNNSFPYHEEPKMWGIDPRTFRFKLIPPLEAQPIPNDATNPLIDCGKSGPGFKFDRDLISEESFNKLKKLINSLTSDQKIYGYIIPSCPTSCPTWKGPFEDWKLFDPSNQR